MTRIYMNDGAIVNTEIATARWDEDRYWDDEARVWVSCATGAPDVHERLYRSSKGHYYVVLWRDSEHDPPQARWLDAREAARWLLVNGRDELPDELRKSLDMPFLPW